MKKALRVKTIKVFVLLTTMLLQGTHMAGAQRLPYREVSRSAEPPKSSRTVNWQEFGQEHSQGPVSSINYVGAGYERMLLFRESVTLIVQQKCHIDHDQ
jgi:hypothetical protein